MATKQANVQLGIIVSTVTDGDYFHIKGGFVTLEGGKVSNGSGTESAPFNGGLRRVYGLHVTSQGDDRHGHERYLYGFDVRYRDVYTADLRDAEAMAATLRTIDRKLDKIYQTRGHAKTFGEYVGRVAEVVGRDTKIMETVRSGSWHSDTEYRYRDLADGISRIDSLEAKWKAAGQPQTEDASA